MFLKSLKLVVFAFLIIGPLVPALAVAEVMVQFNTGFFGTVGKKHSEGGRDKSDEQLRY